VQKKTGPFSRAATQNRKETAMNTRPLIPALVLAVVPALAHCRALRRRSLEMNTRAGGLAWALWQDKHET